MLVSLSLLDWQGGRLVCRWCVVCYVLCKEKKMQVELGGVVNKACPYVVISGTSRGTVSLAGWRPGTVSPRVALGASQASVVPGSLGRQTSSSHTSSLPCPGAEWRLLLPPPRLPLVDIFHLLQCRPFLVCYVLSNTSCTFITNASLITCLLVRSGFTFTWVLLRQGGLLSKVWCCDNV